MKRRFGRHLGSLGWYEDESKPTASVQLFVDYSQKQRAFDLSPGRDATRKLVGVFFDGATFYRTTGIWKNQESGGLSITLYFVERDSGEALHKRKKFIERARACAKFLQETFEQEAVGMLSMVDGGQHRVEFIGDWSTVRPYTELLSKAQLIRAMQIREQVRPLRLPSDNVWGD